jgi:hypothetical protein
MQPIGAGHANEARLRFVFNGKVVSYRVAPDTTFGDIAGTLGKLPRRRYGNPLAIDVTFGTALAIGTTSPKLGSSGPAMAPEAAR